MPITTLGIGAAVTPTVVKTTFSHYTNRKPRAEKPTAHISYDQGLHLIRSFLLYASHHTVEEVQAFTSQWVPHPRWTRIENVVIPEENIKKAVELITAELGEEGIKAVGGRTWWQWRRKYAKLRAEWIEMRSDFNARQRENKKCRRIMLYVHGGAYFFGSVDEHRYQLQRHARKLQARVFAPRYRLAPQFPFPCGMLDCLAAYLYLLTIHDPTEIIFAGDSAGGGMILSMMCLLRDQQMPLPAGAIMISPWVDLTHSFPSLSREDGMDYIPPHGFMQKPSRSWPPPNEDDIYEIVRTANEIGRRKSVATTTKTDDDRKVSQPEAARIAERLQPPLSLRLDGKDILVKDQVQLYTTNQLITHPLVSPALQPSLGGLPPLLIMVGDGELLRDEQIYVAHKAAHPQKYRLNDLYRKHFDPDDAILEKYPPTPVQLQVWDDLCHVTPTLSFTRPAKFMYRSVAQFGAWALSRAQKRGIEIMEDDDDDSSSTSSDDISTSKSRDLTNGKPTPNGLHAQIGRAGDSIPPFRNNMIREQVDRHGNVYPLPRASELPAMQMSADLVGVVKEGPIRRWLSAKEEWDRRYQMQRRRIQKKRVASYRDGNRLVYGDGEIPPPSALAGRLLGSEANKKQHLKKSWGLGMWSSWQWKSDERTMQKEVEYSKQEEKAERTRSRAMSNGGKEDPRSPEPLPERRTSSEHKPSFAPRRKTITVQDQGQVEAEVERRSITPDRGRSPQTSPPIVEVDPPIPSDTDQPDQDQPVSAMFLPKWKQSPHLKNDSKDISDAGSTYSRNTAQDNMSTRAVFSAPGVQRQNSNLPDIPSPNNSNDPEDSPSYDFRPSTPGPRDNLGGYDTPVSKRSVERLRSHQVDLDDQQSAHSSLLVGTTAADPRIEPIRSPSSMAVVHAEGVISPTEEDPPTATPALVTRTAILEQTAHQHVENDTVNAANATPTAIVASTDHQEAPDKEDAATPNHLVQRQDDANAIDTSSTVPVTAVEPTGKQDASDEEKVDATAIQDERTVDPSATTPKQRPAMYNRDDSDFVTAMEKL